MPLISVIIPVYNAKEYLNECIESVVNQNYQNLEIILINDGSTDGSASMCEKWANRDKRIRVIHQENQGAAAARNSGVAKARGSYIYFLDSDDWTSDSTIRELYDLIVRYKAQIAISNYFAYYNNSQTYHFYLSDQDFFEKVYSTQEWFDYAYGNHTFNMLINFVSPCNKLIDKQLFDIGIRFPEGTYREDEGTTYKFYLASDRIAFINKAHYAYRQMDNTLSRQSTQIELPGAYLEEMIMLMAMRGLNIKPVITSYFEILEYLSEKALSIGNIPYYELAIRKMNVARHMLAKNNGDKL